MKPHDFMLLAEHLASRPGEAELRSAISRAYYSAFHEATLLLERCGVRLPASAEAHVKVVFCLQRSADVAISHAATSLGVMRNVRNEADYRLSSAKFDAPFVGRQMIHCRQLIKTFQAADPATAGVGVREYARDVLRMIVSP